MAKPLKRGRPKSANARSPKLSLSFDTKTYQELKRRVKLQKSNFRQVVRELVRFSIDNPVFAAAHPMARKPKLFFARKVKD